MSRALVTTIGQIQDDAILKLVVENDDDVVVGDNIKSIGYIMRMIVLAWVLVDWEGWE